MKSVSPFQGRYLNLPLEIVSEGKATKEHIIPRSVRERKKHKYKLFIKLLNTANHTTRP